MYAVYYVKMNEKHAFFGGFAFVFLSLSAPQDGKYSARTEAVLVPASGVTLFEGCVSL